MRKSDINFKSFAFSLVLLKCRFKRKPACSSVFQPDFVASKYFGDIRMLDRVDEKSKSEQYVVSVEFLSFSIFVGNCVTPPSIISPDF